MERVFYFRNKSTGKKKTYIHETCAQKALLEINISTRPKSVLEMHRLIRKELDKLKALRVDKGTLIKLLLRIGIVTHKIYGESNPFFRKK